MIRRGFLAAATSASAAAAAAGSIAGVPLAAAASAPARVIAVTGTPVPQLAVFDRVMIAALQAWNVPGGQCAVAKDGRLVYARGFGNVDTVAPGTNPPPVSPTARFRIASCTKPMTAVAILKLVELGRLSLDDHAFQILNDLTPAPGMHADPRLAAITVRQLLDHSGGFVYPDANGFDPQFDGLRLAAAACGSAVPATHTDLIRYVMGRPLAFTPGTRYTYSNVGYNILGRIIERRTNMPYGAAVQSLLLDPIGVHRMALMTRSSPQARLDDEVFYDDGPGGRFTSYSIYPDDPDVRTYSYGGFDGRAIDAHGGVIACAPDLTRFLNAVAGASGVQLLRPQTVATMLARQNVPGERPDQYYALGWNVTPGAITMTHAGAIVSGTLSLIFRLPGEITFAVLFNHLDLDIGAMIGSIQTGLLAAAHSVVAWPANDLSPAIA